MARRVGESVFCVALSLVLAGSGCTYTHPAPPVDRTPPTSSEPPPPSEPPPQQDDGSPSAAAPWMAFGLSSVWNADISGAPVDPRSDGILAYLRADNEGGFVRLLNTEPGGTKGSGIWWPTSDDPPVTVQRLGGGTFPERIRIPDGAVPGSGVDGHLTVFDVHGGYQASLWKARHDATTGVWSAASLDVYYNASNGLGSLAAGSNCTPQAFPPLGCHGHRGFAPYIFNVRADEIAAGVIPHALKLGVNDTGGSGCGLRNSYWPATGDEGGNGACAPEGTRLRLRASVRCSVLATAAARTLCVALKTYGAFIGDQTGGDAHLAVENTAIERSRTRFWKGKLSDSSLSKFPLTPAYWEVVQLGCLAPGSSCR